MKNSFILLSLLIAGWLIPSVSAVSAIHYAGGDISLLPEYEKAGAVYNDYEGKKINDLLPWLYDQGMNAMRVRLFVDPGSYDGPDKDPNACQDLDYIIPLCKRIKETGFALMLDFHYSDTWADPAKQWIPKAWINLNDQQLEAKISEYTRETLTTLKENGVVPDFIQPGNEISFGMLWGNYDDKASDLKKTFMGSDANWERLGKLLSGAIGACREVCPDSKIVIHTERVGDIAVERNFYDRMASLKVDYDIIGLSYYPYFHGNLTALDESLSMLEKRYPEKNIMIVETGYAYKWEVPGTTQKVDYPYTEEGQNEFARDLVTLLERHPAVDGLFWWWMEYNAYGTNLGGWYNAPLFNSLNGRACKALKTICSFASPHSGISMNRVDGAIALPTSASPWFDLSGRPVQSNPRKGEIYVTPQGSILY